MWQKKKERNPEKRPNTHEWEEGNAPTTILHPVPGVFFQPSSATPTNLKETSMRDPTWESEDYNTNTTEPGVDKQPNNIFF